MTNFDRKYPFKDCKIDDPSFLNGHEGRLRCQKCGKSRKFFCYTCHIPLQEFMDKTPTVKLPIKIDIIKHKDEGFGKSTSSHAKILAPNDVQIYTYPNIPDYSKEEGVYLVFPAATSMTIQHLLHGQTIQLKENFGLPHGDHMGTLLNRRLADIIETEESTKKEYDLTNLPIKKAVFIDSTWNQCRGIYKDPNVNQLKTVVIQNRLSQFWRHQKGSPRWFLATIEAIHQLVLEIHVYAFGLNSSYKGLEGLEITLENFELKSPPKNEEERSESEEPYNGQYDNMLFFFQHFYDLIHVYYDENELMAYKRPIL